MTYRQAVEKKWQVRKGEKSTNIFFSEPYSVFHVSQVEGIPA
jgi:antirestriction protein ArdC